MREHLIRDTLQKFDELCTPFEILQITIDMLVLLVDKADGNIDTEEDREDYETMKTCYKKLTEIKERRF